MDGKCGTGDDFCGRGKCQLGNCTAPARDPPPSDLTFYFRGNSTDGTCGGPNSFTCNLVHGMCCNKDGACGAELSDCGVGW